MLVEAALAIMAAGGETGAKTITANGVYNASDDDLDGYDPVTVAVPIESATFTNNGTYTAQNGGYSPVIVDVDTYEDEYQALLQCSQQVAAAVGAITGTVPQDCSEILDAVTNDIPAIIDQLEEDVREAEQEAEDAKEEAEECKQCKAQVVAKIQEYNPSFDPQDCQDMVDGVKSVSGYEFPAGTSYADVLQMTGNGTDPITDTTVAVTLAYHIISEYQIEWGYIASDGVFYRLWQVTSGMPLNFVNIKYFVQEPSVGGYHFEMDGTVYQDYYRYGDRNNGLIGFGDSGHNYKVHKMM